MSWSIIAHASASNATGAAGVATTGAINTTGANIIWVAVVNYNFDSTFSTITDSKFNAWANGNNYLDISSSLESVAFYYCVNPNVGSGHTFSGDGNFASIAVLAASGSDGSSIDQQNGADSPGAVSSISPGSITAAANSIVLSALAIPDASGGLSIGSGFTIVETLPGVAATAVGIGLAYKITSGSVNPAWSFASQGGTAVTQASFVGTGGAANTDPPFPTAIIPRGYLPTIVKM